jgi:hypothetical protein
MDRITSAATTVTFSINNLNDNAPVITSGTTGTNLAENSGAAQAIYTIVATDEDAEASITYAIGGTDAGLLSVDSSTGVVILTADPDFEEKSSYSFEVTASDGSKTSEATTVTFSINNLNDNAPVITSGTTGTNLAENSGAAQAIYTIVATDEDAEASITYAIGGTDAGLLSVDSSTGVVILTADPDFEEKSSYSFEVTASDGSKTSEATTVTFSINNLNDNAPVITSGTTGTNLAENSGAAQAIYTIVATDEDAEASITYAIGGTDAGLLSVDSSTGVVILTADPDFEEKSSYSFEVTASDGSKTSEATTVTFSINNLNDNAPVITSGTTGTNLAENSGAAQAIYTIVATDEDAEASITYAIGGTDAGLLSVDSSTGVVILTADPDFEEKSSYSFEVTASDGSKTSEATTVTFSINNLNDNAPVITSGTTGTNLAENSGAAQAIYTIVATDEDAEASITYAIGGTDAGLLSVDSSTGVVILTADPDFEEKSSYSFEVTASDGSKTSEATTVTFSINNLNDNAPVITSGTTGTNLAENSGAAQAIYTIVATDEDAEASITYAIGGTDAGLLSVDSSTGVVILTADPDFEEKSSYSFEVTASDGSKTSAATTVTFSINNLMTMHQLLPQERPVRI